MQLYLINFINNVEKKYEIKDNIEYNILKKSKRINDKENYIAQVYDGRTMYMYDLNGKLLYKEWFNGDDDVCMDYSIKDISDGDIVYCMYNKQYYIMISENNPSKPNVLKFIGLYDYPDECTLYGIPQYFLSKISNEKIKELNLGYLYEMKDLFKEEKYAELRNFKINERG